METTTTESPHRAAPATSRDPAVDLFRAAALAVVVLGHWLLAVVHWRDGNLSARNLLDVEPAAQWATWLFQPMPLFFAVGGWAAARSWSTRSPGLTRSDWVHQRLTRLVVPAGTYVAISIVAVTVIVGVMGDTAAPVAGLLGMHLWFLAVYVPVTAAAPWLGDLIATRGWRVPAMLGVAVVAVDVARFRLGLPGVGWVNFAFLWLGFTALGMAAAHRPPRPGRLVPVALVASGALVAVVWLGWYPHSMVGVGDRSNNTPPTVALALLGLAQVAAAAAGAPRLRHWIHGRRRVERGIGAMGAVGMHLYLWHLWAVVIVVAFMQTGWGNIEPLTFTWWATRPLWWAVLALVAAPVVAGALAVDRRRLSIRGTEGGPGPVRVAATVAVVTGAFAVLALGGMRPDLAGVIAVGGILFAGRRPMRRPLGWVQRDGSTSAQPGSS